MREFDRNQVYFDAMGRPLKGRVYFFVKGSTERQPIYGVDGIQLANPVYTINGKLAPQVFLDDSDYSIMWESYIGDGDMRLDDDSHSWRPAGTADSLKVVVKTEITSFGLVCARNIEHLRTIDPSEISEGMVTLLGYSSAGDKPPINYIWDSSSRDSDNGSTVIKTAVTEQGRFKMVIQEDLDVRHFGVFPAVTMAETSADQALAIAAAHRVAVDNDIRIFFSGIGSDIGYYRLNAGEINHFYCTSENARFIGVSNTVITAGQIDGKPIYFAHAQNYSPTVKLYGDRLRGSFNTTGSNLVEWHPTDRFYIDVEDQEAIPDSFNANTVIPVFESDASKDYTFIGFSFLEGRKLPTSNAYTFINCDFSDRLFVSQTIDWTKVTLTDCVISIENFSRLGNWVAAKSKAGSKDLDFGGKAVSENLELAFNGDCRIINGSFGGSVTISNVAGTTEIINCTFASLGTVNALTRLVSSNSSIDGVEILAGIVELDGCTVGCNIGSSDYHCASVTASGSSFGGKIFTSVPVMRNCVFGDVLESYPDGGTAHFFIQGCVFNSGSFHRISSSTEHTVDGTWKDNVFNGNNGIVAEKAIYGGIGGAIYDGNYGFVDNEGVAEVNATLERYYYYESSKQVFYGLGIKCTAENIELFGYGNYWLDLTYSYSTSTVVSRAGEQTRTLTRQHSITKTVQAILNGRQTVGNMAIEDIFDPAWASENPSIVEGSCKVSYRLKNKV